MKLFNWCLTSVVYAVSGVCLLVVISLGCNRTESAIAPDSVQLTEPVSTIVQGEIGLKVQQNLEPFIRKILSDHACESSVSIGITKGQEVVYAKSFGFKNTDTQEMATPATVYHFASVTKPFTATAIVKLVQQRKLELDDPVVKFLPYFKLKGEGSENITIRQLLTHTSGLPRNEPPNLWDSVLYDEGAVERFVRSFSSLEMQYAPGAVHAYSNIGFDCLADVIAKASGMSFIEYMRTEVLEPCGMFNTAFSKPKELPENWASPHVLVLKTERWEEYPYNRIYEGSSGLHSSVLDMCKWGIANLNRGRMGEVALMDSTSFDLLFYPWVDTPWGEKIGLSWYLQSYEGHRTILHDGEDNGFSSQFIMLPDDSISICVVANRNVSRVARITNAAIETIFDLPIKDYTVTGRIPFGAEMELNGFEAAKSLWQAMEADTTDLYYTNEWEMNVTGHSLIAAKRFAEAKQVFQFNIDEHPTSPNTYDSYGDALLAAGDTLEAISYFMKALEIDPSFPDPTPKLIDLGVNP